MAAIFKFLQPRGSYGPRESAQGTVVAALITASAFMPALMIAATVTAYLLSYPDARSLIVGAGVTGVVWATVGYLGAGFTSLRRANASSYRQVLWRTQAAGALLAMLPAEEFTSEFSRDEVIALREAREEYFSLMALLEPDADVSAAYGSGTNERPQRGVGGSSTFTSHEDDAPGSVGEVHV